MMDVFGFLLILTLLHCTFADSIVSVAQGALNGTTATSSNGREILAFRGIPYAEPPVGDLRFRSPVPKKPWSGILQAQNEGSSCPQTDGVVKRGQEDCLYLNVYTPRVYTNETSLLPVMVYIHGGGFHSGSANIYRPDFLLNKNTVLVTHNYRVGIFGFLSTGDLAAPGNFGLKDQLLVLKWVQQNIKAFGGDPNRVTLFGESAGGVSVNLHALSERSKPLFHRYIIQSGSVLNLWAFHRDPAYYDFSRQYARSNNCPTNDSYSMINCLRTVDADRLLDKGKPDFDFLSQFIRTSWTPVVEPPSDDAFITEFPENLLRKKKLKDSPVITGTVNDEGLLLTGILYSNESAYQLFLNNPLYVIEGILGLYPTLSGKNTTDLAMKVKEFYFGAEMPTDKTKVISAYTDLASDSIFMYPQIQLVEYMRRINSNPLYFYNFNYSGPFSFSFQSTGLKKFVGVAHADDLLYLFPVKASDLNVTGEFNFSEKDYKIVDLMVDLWTTFANTSIPKSSQLQNPALWQSYKIHRDNLQIGNGNMTETRLEHSYFAKRMKFWYDNVPPYLLYEGQDTY